MKLIIFDKDGTLVGVPDPAANRPANRPEEQVLLPGRLEKIKALRKQGMRIALASNQGGVAWGFITYDQAAALMADCARKIGGADIIRFCPHDARAAGKPNAREHYAIQCGCRKPAPGMLQDIMAFLRVTPEETVFVGDRDEDRTAAEAAGVRFMWADEFFR
ncbi:MAG: HAD-IIIA family hydrolase [Chloroflexota bacterium]|jgi:D-glycero-D-manno-heptose 1,7-bisphosphate phosphatase